jgi:hypothetical protein
MATNLELVSAILDNLPQCNKVPAYVDSSLHSHSTGGLSMPHDLNTTIGYGILFLTAAVVIYVAFKSGIQ